MLLSIISLTCIIPAAKADITVTVVNTWGWEDMYTFVWQGEDFYFDWPGQQMTETGAYFRGKKVYQYTFPSTYGNIIFNNGLTGTGNQTADLVVNASKPCYYNGNWYASLDSIPSMQADANIPVATLSHNGNILTFNGNLALRWALDYANNGDTINLSAGSFQSPGTITKIVTIRGIGLNNAQPTIIMGETTFNVSSSSSGLLQLEGLYFDDHTLTLLGDITFTTFQIIKCRIYEMKFSGNFMCNNMVCINDIFWKISTGNSWQDFFSGNFNLINSFVEESVYIGSGSAVVHSGRAINSIINSPMDNEKWSYTNCIIIGDLDYGAVSTNCAFVEGSGGSYSINGYDNVAYNSIFKTYTGTYSSSETFELTPTAQANFLGTDGTQVGIYGGILPYDPTPTYPQIKTMNIGSKSNSDGMLDIEIEL